MKRTISFAAIALSCLLATAQTARKFTVNLTADGKANMQVFLPEKPSGRAIVDCPGGGYSHLSMQNEGTDWAEWFNSQGIAFCVLKYRMPGGDRTIPLSDAENAIRTVRDSAQAWGVNPYDVGIMGFSAGGHLASSISTHNTIATRPDFAILFYPVISMDEKLTHKGSVVGFLGDQRSDEKLVRQWSNDKQVLSHRVPPTFLVLAGDDRAVPPLTNALPYYTSLRKCGIPAALHIYPRGGHGFGFKTTFAYHDLMLQELTAWLQSFSAPKASAKRVACIGNSITDGHGIADRTVNGYPAQLQKLLGQDYNVKNFGVSARTLLTSGDKPYVKEQLWRDAKAYCPDVVVLKLGTNDSKPKNWEGHEKDFARDLQQMVDTLKSLPSQPRIILCEPIESNTGAITGNDNQVRDSVVVAGIIPAIHKVAKKNKLELLSLRGILDMTGDDMQRDGIHPTEKGAKKLADAVAKAIKAAPEAAKAQPASKKGKKK